MKRNMIERWIKMTGKLIQEKKNLTPLEAIIKGNAERLRIPSSSAFGRILLDMELEGRAGTWYTGTGFAIEAMNKPFGKTIEKEFKYEGECKLLIYNVRKEDIGARDIMNLFEHGFRADGEKLIQPINAKTEKQILTFEGLCEASEIILKVVGDIRNFHLTNRDGRILFETAQTKIWADDSSALGLLRRGYEPFVYYDWGDVCAGDPLGKLGVPLKILYEVGEKEVENVETKTDSTN